MVRSRAQRGVSNHATRIELAAILRDASLRDAPQDEDSGNSQGYPRMASYCGSSLVW
jgi:hypothetical protein